MKPAEWVVAVLLFLPLAPLVPSWHANPDGLALLGRASGLFGMSCLFWAAILSVRVPGWDIRFGGLTRVWKAHHLLGAAAFLCAMAHPLLLAFSAARAASPSAAAEVLFPGREAWAFWAGWLALAAMATFLAPTFWFFGRPEYSRWKILHALSGPALLLALAHVFPLARTPLARLWALGLGAAGTLAFLYRQIPSLRRSRAFHTIVAVRPQGRGVVELTLRPEEGRLDYRSGQFVYMTPLDEALSAGQGEEHPYTLSSAPGEPELRLMIKDLGDATHALQAVSIGSRTVVEGPYGDFTPGRTPKELWIAGGVGLAPFLSAARSLSAQGNGDVLLIYCVQDASRAHFREELAAVAARVPGFALRLHFFEREGALTGAYLRTHCPDADARETFVCGPPPLVEGARRELRRLGLPRTRFHSEDFTWL